MIITPVEIGSGLVSILFHGSQITVRQFNGNAGLVAGEPGQIHGRAEVDE